MLFMLQRPVPGEFTKKKYIYPTVANPPAYSGWRPFPTNMPSAISLCRVWRHLSD